MKLQELIDYFDSHQRLQEKIRANSWKYWQMELDELIDKLED